jgi:hypothetical protein
MMYPPCHPWVGWYGPWASPPMHFHPGWSVPTEGFGYGATMQEIAVTDTPTTSRTGGPWGRKTRQSRMVNQSMQFPQKQQLFLVVSTSKEHRKMDLRLIDPEAAKGRQGRGARLQPMRKQSSTRRKSKRGGGRAGQGPRGRDQDRSWDRLTTTAKPDILIS